ncbi:MAG: DNA internalization-related competence protein ComEC/Rec2 [Clostridia bacterium]|nr:DNA internalization-related competence protein ComEC/Rec2 [Clostridia bacterium]
MKRTFVWMTVSFLFGIYLAAKAASVLFYSLSVVFFALFLLSVIMRRRPWRFFLALSLGFVLGFVLFTLQFRAYLRTPVALHEKEITLAGRVTAVGESSTGKLRLTLTGETEGEAPVSVRAYIYPGDVPYTVGDCLRISGKAIAPQPPDNFGATDYRISMMRQRIDISMFCTKEDIVLTGHDFRLTRISDLMYLWRTKVSSVIARYMPSDTVGFLNALLTGDTTSLYEEQKADLQHAGISHVIAVSGMHLQILVHAFMLLFGAFRIKKRSFSFIVYGLLIWLFVLFSGASMSVLRAAIMLTLSILSGFIRKDEDAITGLFVAAFILCAQNTASFFDIGLQLSCASTLGILLFAAPLDRLMGWLPSLLRKNLSVSMSATLGFFPLAALYFGTMNACSLLVNVLVCPIIPLLMIGGFLGIAASGLPWLAQPLFRVLAFGIRYILWVADFFSSIPAFSLPLQQTNWPYAILYLLFCLLLSYLLRKQLRQALWTACILLFGLFLLLFGNFLIQNQAVVTFLNVGNADCTLITTTGHVYLFDSGGSKQSDIAAKTILPYLRYAHTDKIDVAFLTHYHSDHAKGFLTLLEGGYIQEIVLPYHADNELKPALLRAAYHSNTKVRYASDGDLYTIGSMQIGIFDTATGGEENNGVVYSVRLWDTRVLLTGDISKTGEKQLLHDGADIDSDILKVPHHGSPTSGLLAFTDAVSPDLAVITCGPNSYGHPHASVLEQYAQKKIPVLRSDERGTIAIYITKDGIRKTRTLR